MVVELRHCGSVGVVIEFGGVHSVGPATVGGVASGFPHGVQEASAPF